MFELVNYQVADGVAKIDLCRSEAGNAMNWQLVDEFAAAVEYCSQKEGVRAFLITGQGKHFSVGGDIRAFSSASDSSEFLGRLVRRLHEGLLILAKHPAPVVIATQGAAAGAALSLVASGDVVLAAEDASFAMAYTGIGLTADGGASWHLPRVIGVRATQEMAYLGRKLTAPEALELGLVTKLVSSDQLTEEAELVVHAIAAGPTLAFGGIKRLLAESYGTTLADQLDREASAIVDAMRTKDAQNAMAAFLNRQQPVFNGE